MNMEENSAFQMELQQEEVRISMFRSTIWSYLNKGLNPNKLWNSIPKIKKRKYNLHSLEDLRLSHLSLHSFVDNFSQMRN